MLLRLFTAGAAFPLTPCPGRTTALLPACCICATLSRRPGAPRGSCTCEAGAGPKLSSCAIGGQQHSTHAHACCSACPPQSGSHVATYHVLLLVHVHEAEQVVSGSQPLCLLPDCVKSLPSRDSGGAVGEGSLFRSGATGSNVSSSSRLKPRGLGGVSTDQEFIDNEGSTSPAGGGRLRWNPELTRTNTGGGACRDAMLLLLDCLLLLPGAVPPPAQPCILMPA